MINLVQIRAEAVTRARSMIGRGTYGLGKGGYQPAYPDEPWNHGDPTQACDCSGFVTWTYRFPRTRAGFNRGPWSTVADAINTTSMVEDALHRGDLFNLAPQPELGALLVYPGYKADSGNRIPGHCAVIVGVSRCLEWDASNPAWHLLDVVQCRGGEGKKPGIIASDGSHWEHYDAKWIGSSYHQTHLLRVVGF